MSDPMQTRIPRWLVLPAGLAAIVVVTAAVVSFRQTRTCAPWRSLICRGGTGWGKPIIPGPGSRAGTAAEVAGVFKQFSVWLRNDHVSHPINFTDIERYKVAFRWGSSGEALPGTLSTDLPEDLYFEPPPL